MAADRTDSRKKLMEAWRAAARRLIEIGYDKSEVLETMAAVALSGDLGGPVDQKAKNKPEERQGSQGKPKYLGDDETA